ncbi:acyltransferase [Vibrio breoganii]|uniref:Acyltransferase n=1 Tax=Vibrio breoganii TaxID=553239 RepID=A0AAN0XSG1_9VIBR|nr:acyltransferase [Vibrio breoganii]ANO31709.1 acyltransferase [Vibrio breoganii]
MLGYLILVINASLVIFNTALSSIAICIFALIRALVPISLVKRFSSHYANKVMWLWATINALILSLSNKVNWQVEGVDGLNYHGWYLMLSNHRSWTDIVVLCCVFKDRIPMPKFFLKQQLLYVPFLGMACWALDMPFMRRYSREYLLRHPEKRGKDLDTTRRSCERFQHIPTTVVNYVEGTRYRSNSHNQSQYKHLLLPKAGGIAYTLAAMGEQFDNIIDVTLACPDNVENPFKDMLMGRMQRIVVKVNVLPVDDQVLGDYFGDKQFKRQFQLWLGDLWNKKDKELDKLYSE